MADSFDPLAKSGDYQKMEPYWNMIDAILGGVDQLRKAREVYLPRFPSESKENYEHRLKIARLTNIFGDDILPGLASKPFTKECRLANDSAPDVFKTFCEDVDGAGNNLHAFAESYFYNAIGYSMDWLFVDYTKVPEGATAADERAMGARPLWSRIPATDMLAVYSAVVKGREQFVYARIRENNVRISSGDEETVERVRVLIRDPILDDQGAIIDYGSARYEIWEKGEPTAGGEVVWRMVESGPITIGVIALVPLVTGRRFGSSWSAIPLMQGAARLQIEHYQDETNLKCAKELTAFPMFAGNGVRPPMMPNPRRDESGQPAEIAAPVNVGPATILYAPMSQDGKHGTWNVLEISATSLEFLSRQIDKTEAQMRELGRMPLTAGTAGLTQVAAAFASQKSASAVQAWAWMLKDALEQAFVFTAMWLKQSFEPEVYVHTDFAVEIGADKGPEHLLKLRERGELSTETLWSEFKRRGILGPEFDADTEQKRIEEEMPGDDTEADIIAAMPPPPAAGPEQSEAE